MGNTFRQLGFRPVRKAWRWWGPVPAIVLLVMGVSALTLTRLPPLPLVLWVGLTAIAVVHAGLPEEVFYRVLLQTRLELLLGSKSGVALASLLFGLRHVPSRFIFVWAAVAGTSLGGLALTFAVVLSYQVTIGMVFGYMWTRYRNAWMNVAGHTAFDVLAFAGLLSA